MKYCTECKVSANDNLTNCPLCGAYLKDTIVDSADIYRGYESHYEYTPLTKNSGKKNNFLRQKSFLLVLAITLICIFINWTTSPTVWWSAYTTIGMFLVYTCVLNPIYTKRRFYANIAVWTLCISVGLIVIDLFNNYLIFGTWDIDLAFRYELPAVLVVVVILSDFMIFFEKTHYKYYLMTMVGMNLLCLVPGIVALAVGTEGDTWVLLTSLYFGIANLLIMSIVYFKQMRYEFKKKFFV